MTHCRHLSPPCFCRVANEYLRPTAGVSFSGVKTHHGVIHNFHDIVEVTGKNTGEAVQKMNETTGGMVPSLLRVLSHKTEEPPVRITSLAVHRGEVRDVCTVSLDAPALRSQKSRRPFSFSGWIVGKDAQFTDIDIMVNGDHFMTIPVDIPRPDVGARFAPSSASQTFGFTAYCNPFTLPRQFDIEGYARSGKTGRIKIFTLSGERRAIGTDHTMTMRPLAVTTLGRTGSTYLLGLLSAHPGVSVYRPFELEARYASYWVQMFLALSHPQSWLFPLASSVSSDPAWILGSEKEKSLHYAVYDDMTEWFGGTYTEEVYSFCMRSLGEHYRRVAALQGKKDALYFSEKFLPGPFTDTLLSLMPAAREIILVRDFRDMFCSIDAFNKKRGFLGFGREAFSSDEEYVSHALRKGAEALGEARRKRRASSCLVRYEDLVRNPEDALRNIFEYCELDASPSAIRGVMRRTGKTKPESQKVHQTTPDAHQSLERFRSDLSPHMLDLCNRVFREPLELFGYDVKG